MPWSIEEEHTECPASEPFAVVKDDDGEVVGCHMTREAANEQLAALYANEPSASRGRMTFDRLWDVEDVIIRADGTGRTVEAYAAIFDQPAEIKDQHGHYMEEIDPRAFNRTLSHGDVTRFGVYYHHGMTLYGTPSDLGSVPVGRPMEVKADKRGLLTVTRYNRSELADAVLEAIRNGDLRGYSFRGRIIKSDPRKPPRIRRSGPLPRWRHLELGLAEYGPTPSPAYADAGILAVRSARIANALDEAKQLITDLSSSTPQDPDDDTATPTEGHGAEDPPERHSGRQKELIRLRAEIRQRGVLNGKEEK